MDTAPLHLLIAEDEAAHVEAIRRAFEGAGTKVDIRAVATLREYRACLAERPPDLALVDLNLPDGRAVEILTQPPEDAAFPVLVMTAFGNQQVVVEVMKAGALDYIVKSPETFVAMPHTVESVLREWKLLQKHQQMEETLRISEEQFRAMFEVASIGIAQANPQTGQWVRVNQKMCAITGYSAAELLQMKFRELTHPDDRQKDWDLFQQVVRGEAPDYRMEKRYLRKDGAVAWVNVNMTVIRDAAGQPTRTMATIEDITVRKQAEDQLRDSRRQLGETLTELLQTQQQVIQQESLRVLGQMAAGMAHDFNNALSPILGFSELLLDHPEKLVDQERVARSLQIINTCAQDASSVVRRLREFSRKRGRGDILQAIDLPGLVRQAIELTQPRWKDQAQAAGLTIHIATDLRKVPPIGGEEFAIRELLTNLIFNAVDALPVGGTITLGTATDGDFVRLWVSDTGTGMTGEVRQRCLEPFFTTKGMKGTGLGLSMVHGIVQRHGGTVEIASELGHGTTVSIRLPLRLPETETALAQESALARKLRVLVVDDEPLLRDVAEACLTDDGHTVETVATGVAALARLQAGRFDVVITDKAMPEMNGEQLAVAINQGAPGLPVILMSGFGDMMKAAGEMPPHIRVILSKPFTRSTLRAALAKVVPPQLPDKR